MARVPNSAARDRLRAKVEAAARAAFRAQGPWMNKNAVARGFEGRGASPATIYRWVDAALRGGRPAERRAIKPGAAARSESALRVRYDVLAVELRRVRRERDDAVAQLDAQRRAELVYAT